MNTRTNLFASITVGLCGLLSACSDPVPYFEPKFPNFIRAYVRATPDVAFVNNTVHLNGAFANIEIAPDVDVHEQSVEVNYNDIYYDGHIRNDKQFQEIAKENNDTDYLDKGGLVTCFLQANTRVDIISDKDYAAGYPAGASLNDLFRIRAWEIKAFIDGNYDRNNPLLWGKTYFWYLVAPTPKVIDGVVSPEMTLLEWNTSPHPLFPTQNLLLSDVLPDQGGEYRFTVTYTFDDGATASFTTEPVTLSAKTNER